MISVVFCRANTQTASRKVYAQIKTAPKGPQYEVLPSPVTPIKLPVPSKSRPEKRSPESMAPVLPTLVATPVIESMVTSSRELCPCSFKSP